LLQGADERYVALLPPVDDFQLLFPGTSRGHGQRRHEWFRFMKHQYGEQFRHFEAGCHKYDLRSAVAATKLIVAPEFPVSDRYWSNRAYLICGFGGCLLHPYSAGLAKHYQEGSEILFYQSRSELTALIERYLDDPDA